MNPIPEKLVDYNVYTDGERLVGLEAELTLPDFEAVTNEIAGPGILGTIESPTPGHFGSLSVDLTFRTCSKEAAKLVEPRGQTITLRGDQSSYDVSEGRITQRGLKVVFRGLPKKFSPGKFKAAEATGTAVSYEIYYIKITLDDDILLELDKFNYIYIVNNTDYLAEVRNNI